MTASTRPSRGSLLSIPGIRKLNSMDRSTIAGYDKVLSQVSLRIRKGELIAVMGPVGAGKTSLLLSLLGENYILGKGTIQIEL